MADKYVNKFVLDNEVKFDLTGDTVTPAQLAQGVTAHDASGAPIVGTSTKDSDTQDATATASEILAGKTAYARGAKVNGTMPNRGGISKTITAKAQQVAIDAGCHDGSGKVSIDATEQAKLIPGNIKSGVTLLGIVGSLSPASSVTAQSKSVTPTMSQQTVLPDAGYDYLSQVVVAAIPVTYTDNAAGGMTLTIG